MAAIFFFNVFNNFIRWVHLSVALDAGCEKLPQMKQMPRSSLYISEIWSLISMITVFCQLAPTHNHFY